LRTVLPGFAEYSRSSPHPAPVRNVVSQAV
jgi:hypothetical protein